ncbi:hypothetical protein DB41_CZ00030 [Neochlamydia sp. TUME1]|nr:hypothetical protein DB41_CZ00030 [Neochlamydia sp. TUME1]
MLAVWRKNGRIFKVSSYLPFFLSYLLELLFSLTASVEGAQLKKFINRLTY